MLGIVLAAGDGRRMGGRKARLLVDGQPLVVHHVRRLLDAGCVEVIAAVRPDDVALTLHAVASTAKDALGSLRVALARARLAHDLVVITPVDALPVRLKTLATLVEHAARARAAVPTYDGAGGHPVVVWRHALDALDRHASLRELLRALGTRCARVPVDDADVTADLDTPADVMTHTSKAPVFLQ